MSTNKIYNDFDGSLKNETPFYSKEEKTLVYNDGSKIICRVTSNEFVAKGEKIIKQEETYKDLI